MSRAISKKPRTQKKAKKPLQKEDSFTPTPRDIKAREAQRGQEKKDIDINAYRILVYAATAAIIIVPILVLISVGIDLYNGDNENNNPLTDMIISNLPGIIVGIAATLLGQKVKGKLTH